MRYTKTTVGEVRHGQAFCVDPKMVEIGREKPRVMSGPEVCASRPHNHIHLGQDCYWRGAVVYVVTR